MARSFTDAIALFNHLLDRHEAGTGNPIAYPDYDGFTSVAAADAFIRELRKAEENGAVGLAAGRGARRDHIAHVRLDGAEVLYRHIGRKPANKLADEAHADLVRDLRLHSGLAEVAFGVKGMWSRAKSWHGYSPAEARKIRNAFVLAQAILDGQHTGSDYRTFSQRVTGDSKALERVEAVVVHILSGLLDLPPGARPREALRTLGLEKFALPLLLAGRLALGDADMSRYPQPYIGLPPSEAHLLRFIERPAYLLTIENFASFNRHVIEADPERCGATVYVGGYPSLATQQALRMLAGILPLDVPLYHWSDIDPDGAWIFRTIERVVGRQLRPHLMTEELAERFGKVSAEKSAVRIPPGESSIFMLAKYLASPHAKTLEQEGLDPTIPAA